MFGQYKHTIDSKGRLIVPSKLREELGECFYVTVAPDTCLTIFTKPEWEKVIERSNQISLTHSGGLRMLIGKAWQCEPDKQGRFILPEYLRDFAGIREDVIFLGLGGRGELWAAEQYEAREAEQLTPDAIRAALIELGF
ncbi:MAG: division/cell wall cluster transcriptional repressor MraZ [Oscillospiraceae bacterium]|nr:division/cell wall cluster transcriptional repressor MraZ [Oscillospiraceae bacterium]